MPQLNPELQAHLLRFRNPDVPLGAFDGVVTGATADESWVISTPNQKTIPHPPLGDHRTVRIRADGLYGDDDYIQWPQPYSSRHPHHACIPRPQTCGPRSVIWLMPDRSKDFVTQTVVAALGKLHRDRLHELETVVAPLQQRIVKYKSEHPQKKLEALDPLNQALTHSLTRLKSVATTFPEMVVGLRDFQRCWLEITALLDYAEIYRPRMNGTVAESMEVANTVGAFVHSHREAQDFYRAGIPYWFMHPGHKIYLQEHNNLAVVSLSLPEETLEMEYMPYSQPIYVGAAGDEEKLTKIIRAARGHLSYANPFCSSKPKASPQSSRVINLPVSFPNAPIPSTSQVVFTSSPVSQVAMPSASPSQPRASRSSRHRKSNKQPGGHPYSQGSRPAQKQGKEDQSHADSAQVDFPIKVERFLPINHAFYPTPIPSWQTALQMVDRDRRHIVHHSKRSRSDSRFVFPDPLLFLSTNVKRQAFFFSVWAAVRDACVYRVAMNPTEVQPVSLQLWRDFLSLADNFRKESLQEVFQSAFEHLNLSFEALRELSPSSLEDIPSLQRALWDLHQLNFHYEVIALDRRLSPAAVVSSDDHRSRLLACFGPESQDPFVILQSSSGAGLASTYSQDRLPLLSALRTLFLDWECTLPSSLVQPPPSNTSSAPAIAAFEKDLARFYCQTFFNYFGRAPIIPYRLQ